MPITIPQKAQRREFIAKIEELSGQNVHRCFQCGTCSGACPMTSHMDAGPRMVMRMAHLGLKEKLERLNTWWICSSCLSCHVRCPRGIDVAKVMEALRLMTLRENRNYVEPSFMNKDVLKDCPAIGLVAAFRKMTC